MYDSRSRLVVEVSEQLKTTLRQPALRHRHPRNIRLAEAPAVASPPSPTTPTPKAQAYLDLADELIARLEK